MTHPRHLELLQLVDDEDLDAVLRIATLDEIAAAWCSYTTRTASDNDGADDDPDWWAIEFFMMRPIFDDVSTYRSALLKLLEHAPDDYVIGCIAAGPLENFISDNEDDLRWIEEEAPTNGRLREALVGTWVATGVSETTLGRLDRAAGTQLPRPRPQSEWPPEVVEHDEALDQLRRIAGDDWWEIANPTLEQRGAIDRYLVAMHALGRLGNADGNTDP